MGRKTRLTGALIAEICRHIEEGNFPEVACRLAGVPERTFYDWMKKGGTDDGSSVYHALRFAVGEAKARWEGRLAADVAASDSVRAKMWVLERIAPERWGRKRVVEVGDHDYYREWREARAELDVLHTLRVDLLDTIRDTYPDEWQRIILVASARTQQRYETEEHDVSDVSAEQTLSRAQHDDERAVHDAKTGRLKAG